MLFEFFSSPLCITFSKSFTLIGYKYEISVVFRMYIKKIAVFSVKLKRVYVEVENKMIYD